MKTHFKKSIFLVVYCLISISTVFAQKKPNIILLFADDISARELPIYGSSVWSKPEYGNTSDIKLLAKMPVLDKLANEGVWIKNTWSATVCSPSRAMMMTGRYAHIHKWWLNNDIGTTINANGKKDAWPLYESSAIQIGHIAHKAGYGTYWAGKSQMKNSDLSLFGFEEGVFTPGEEDATDNPYTNFVIESRKINGKKIMYNVDSEKAEGRFPLSSYYWKPSVRLMNHPEAKNKMEWWPNTTESQKKFGVNTYAPDVELDFIFDFIERQHKKEKPFFVYHTSHLGHDSFNWLIPNSKENWPGTPKIEWKNGKYKRTEPNITGDKGVYNLNGTVTEPGMHSHLNYLDYQIWCYMEKLKEMGELENTIFIFCADNGTSGYGKKSPEIQKGTHVPLMIYAPGLKMTKKGEQDVLANIADILPTIADLVGEKIPSDYEINGVSLIPFLTTNQKEHRDWIYAYHSDKQLIRGKLVLKDGKEKWYDVSKTPDDLISYPEIKDWSKVSKEYLLEKKKLEAILPQFNLHKTAHDNPAIK